MLMETPGGGPGHILFLTGAALSQLRIQRPTYSSFLAPSFTKDPITLGLSKLFLTPEAAP